MTQLFTSIVAALFISACGPFSPFSSGDGLMDGESDGNTLLIETVSQGNLTEGQFDANATESQQMTGSGSLSTAGLTMPVGTLAINTTIQIAPGTAMDADPELNELGISSNEVTGRGPAVAIMPADRNVAPAMPLTIQIPAAFAAGLGLLQENSRGYTAVLCRIIKPGVPGTELLVIPSKDVRLVEGAVQFESRYFGSFQAVKTAVEVAERVSFQSQQALPEPDFVTPAGQSQQAGGDDPVDDDPVDDDPGGDDPGGDDPVGDDPVGDEPIVAMNLQHGERPDADNQFTVTFSLITGASSHELAMTNSSSFPSDDNNQWRTVSAGTHVYDLTLSGYTDGSRHFVHGRAKDASGQIIETSRETSGGFQVLRCPPGYVKVRGNTTAGLGGPDYTHGTQTEIYWDSHGYPSATERGISDFCVMQFEAREGANVASFDASTVAHRGVSGTDAAAACRSHGPGFHFLMTNNFWQAMAREIESVSANWNTEGTILNFGQHDGNGTDLVNPTNPADECYGITGVAADCGGEWHQNRRTHVLASGEKVWDVAGHLTEKLADRPLNRRDTTTWNTVTDDAAFLLTAGPYEVISGAADTPHGGLGKIFSPNWPDAGRGYMERGGSYYSPNHAGIFTYWNGDSPVGRGDSGYRCVYAP